MSDHVRMEVEHPHDPAGDVMVIRDWLSYEVESDAFTPADGFTLRVAPTKEYLDFFRESGHPVRLYYKNNKIMTGVIEATPVNVGDHGPQIELTGRDGAGALVDDAAPLLDLANQSLQTILEKLIAAHRANIAGIITDNSANRLGLVGKHPDYSKVRAIRAREKAKMAEARRTKADIEAAQKEINAAARAAQSAAKRSSRGLYAPYSTERNFKSSTQVGEKIWSVIERLAKHVGMTAFMTADNWLFVGRPDYEQKSIGRLFTRINDLGAVTDSNCLMTLSPDTGNRYGEYLCLGQGRAHATASGKQLSDFSATARDASRTFWWDELQRRVQKVKTLSVKNTGSKKQLTRYARTMMEQAVIRAYNCTATIQGHEVYPGGPLWAVDTKTEVEFGPKAIDASHWIRRRQFTYDVEGGLGTDLSPVPCDIWLAHDHDTLTDKAHFALMQKTFRKYAL